MISSETSGEYEMWIMQLLKAERDESGDVDEDA